MDCILYQYGCRQLDLAEEIKSTITAPPAQRTIPGLTWEEVRALFLTLKHSSETGSLYGTLVSWNLQCRSGWPLPSSQRYTCLCFQSAGIKKECSLEMHSYISSSIPEGEKHKSVSPGKQQRLKPVIQLRVGGGGDTFFNTRAQRQRQLSLSLRPGLQQVPGQPELFLSNKHTYT